MSKSSFRFILSIVLILIFILPVVGQTRVGKFGVGVDGSMQYALGSTPITASPGIGYGVNLSYSIMEYLGLRAKFCANQLGWKTSNAYGAKSISTDLTSLCVYVCSDLMPNDNFNIFPFAGGGLTLLDPRAEDGTRHFSSSSSDLNYSFGAGADYFINEFWSVTLMAEYVLTNNPHYVGNADASGKLSNDSFMRASVQVRYYFFDSAFISKLLEAQRERSKHRQ